MNKTDHLSVDELILFMDRELDLTAAIRIEQHLLTCGGCEQQLRRLQSGSEAYGHYRDQVLEPALRVSTAGSAAISRKANRDNRRNWVLGWAVAFACGLALALIYLQLPKQPSVQEVLTRAASAPEPTDTTLLFTYANERLFRPAVLKPGNSEARFRQVRALFVQANYNWAQPLSARSFADWRRRLPQKEESVTSVRDSANQQFYRVRTSTATGILHAATLTLQAGTYHPTKAGFEFQGEALMELSEQTGQPKRGLQDVRTTPPVVARTVETPATPDDELRVFAALDTAGVEAEEAIDVTLDAGRNTVLVTGMSLPMARRQQIETAMAGLPHTAVHFNASQQFSGDIGAIASPNSDAPDDSFAFRKNLQDRYGGGRELQTATDRALDASNGLFARAHLLLLLSREFPPAVESGLTPSGSTTLLSLRQRHVGAMEYALRELKEGLAPLLPEDLASNTSDTAKKIAPWQSGAGDLFAGARNLDRLLSRLLAGRHGEQEGNRMLNELPEKVSKVEAMVHEESVANIR